MFRRLRGSIQTIFFIAIRDVVKNKLVLSVVLIALGFLFTNLLFARFMVGGFRETWEYDLIKISGHVSVLPKESLHKETEDDEDSDKKPIDEHNVARQKDKRPGYSLEREKADYIPQAPDRIAQLRGIPEVVGVTPILTTGVVFRYGGKEIPGTIYGLPPHDEVTVLKESMVEGSYFPADYNPEKSSDVLLGKYLAEKLAKKKEHEPRVPLGNKVRIIFSNDKLRTYTVRGVFDARDYEANYGAILPFEELQLILRTKPDEVSQLLIRLTDKAAVSHVQQLLAPLVNPHLVVETWEDKDDMGFPDLVRGFRLVGDIIFGVGLVSSAIVVAIIIYINAIRKRRQIGIIRAIGIRNWMVVLIFTVQAFILAALGVGVGTGLYWGLDHYLKVHPIAMPFGDMMASFEWEDYVISVVLFMTTAVLSGFYPAWIITREPIARITSEL